MLYDITVQTIVTHDDGRPFWRDTMHWSQVDDEVRDWLAGSCKTALFHMIGAPEVAAGSSYTIGYRTVVTQGNTVVSDTTLVEFPLLSYATVVEFQRFALDALREMQALMVRKHAAPPTPVRQRNRALALLKLIWGRARAAMSNAQNLHVHE